MAETAAAESFNVASFARKMESDALRGLSIRV